MKLLPIVEHAVKGPVWDCRMCGQCVLHSTGMTCPMTCPKTLRNGPCGGVREDGHCEVKPEMTCVWLTAYDRSREMPLLPRAWRREFNHLRPPVDNQLRGDSSWVNLVTGRDREVPPGWAASGGADHGDERR
jgi:Methylene-tetrahydrofolate reductase C terminal